MSATDAILQDILSQAKITNNNLNSLLRQGGGRGTPGGGGGTSPGGGLGLSSIISNFSLLGKVTGAIGSTFNMLSNVVGGTLSRFTDLSTTAAQGTAQLSQLYQAFEDIPVVGTLAKMFGAITQYQEELLVSYRDLTKSGASFSGNLYEMRRAAYASYMTMEEFSRVVKDTSSLFATSIGGVDAGLRLFGETQRKLVDPNSPMGRSLAGLGVTATEAGEMLTTFMRLQGNMGKLSKTSTESMAESTGGLIKQLDAYSKLTGESREIMEKELKDRAFDEQKKMFLESLDPQQRAQAEAALLAAAKMGGKGLEDEVAVRLMSNNQIKVAGTEAANNLRITTRNQSAASADILASLINLKPGSEEAVAALQAARAGIAQGTGQFNQAVGGPGMAGILSFFKALTFATEQAQTYNQENGKTITDEERRRQILAEQNKQSQGNAAELARNQLLMKIFGSRIGTSMMNLLEKFDPAIKKVSDLLIGGFGKTIDYASGLMDDAGNLMGENVIPAFTQGVEWLENTFKELMSAKSPKEFFEVLGQKVKDIGKTVVELAGNIFEFLKEPIERFFTESVRPMIARIGAGMLDWIISQLRKSRIGRAIFSETDTEREEKLAVTESPEYKALYDKAYADALAAAAAAAGPEGGAATPIFDEAAVFKAAQEAIAKRATATPRALGSLGMTGNLFENFGTGTPAMLHGKEAVVTPTQMESLINNNLSTTLQTLNIQVAELIRTNKEIADYARRNVDATRSLSGDLFAA